MSKTWLKSRVQRRARLFLQQLLNTRKARRTFHMQEYRPMPALTVPLISVPFLGSTIFVTDEVDPRVPMRPIVEALGLVWGAQQQKLNSSKSRWSVSMIDTVAGDGKLREMLGIPLRRLWSWLAGLTPSRVKPEIRPRLEHFQAECDSTLHLHWTRARQGLPMPPAPGEQPQGNMLATIYGPSRAAGDPEAERLAEKIVQARQAGAPFRKEETAAKQALVKLGYTEWEWKLLIGMVKRRLKLGATQPQLALEG